MKLVARPVKKLRANLYRVFLWSCASLVNLTQCCSHALSSTEIMLCVWSVSSCWKGEMRCHLANLALLMRKEVYTAFYCRNRTAMDESFTTSDEIEQSKIEEIAEIPNADKNMTVCSCRGMCTREKGRNACPCKGIGQYCSSVCHPDENTCFNRRNLEIETDSSEVTF